MLLLLIILLWIIHTNKSLKPCTLTSTCLFLDGHDFQNFIVEWRTNEEVNDFEFLTHIHTIFKCYRLHARRHSMLSCMLLRTSGQRIETEDNDRAHLNRQREQVDLFQRRDFTILNQTAKLGDWHPFLFGFLASATAATASTSSAAGPSPAESTAEITASLCHI